MSVRRTDKNLIVFTFSDPNEPVTFSSFQKTGTLTWMSPMCSHSSFPGGSGTCQQPERGRPVCTCPRDRCPRLYRPNGVAGRRELSLAFPVFRVKIETWLDSVYQNISLKPSLNIAVLCVSTQIQWNVLRLNLNSKLSNFANEFCKGYLSDCDCYIVSKNVNNSFDLTNMNLKYKGILTINFTFLSKQYITTMNQITALNQEVFSVYSF